MRPLGPVIAALRDVALVQIEEVPVAGVVPSQEEVPHEVAPIYEHLSYLLDCLQRVSLKWLADYTTPQGS